MNFAKSFEYLFYRTIPVAPSGLRKNSGIVFFIQSTEKRIRHGRIRRSHSSYLRDLLQYNKTGFIFYTHISIFISFRLFNGVINNRVKPFHPNGLFPLNPLKTSERLQRFSDVFRGYRKRPVI